MVRFFSVLEKRISEKSKNYLTISPSKAGSNEKVFVKYMELSKILNFWKVKPAKKSNSLKKIKKYFLFIKIIYTFAKINPQRK